MPDEFVPLARRSEVQLRQLLNEGVDYNWPIDHYLHWPEGLSILSEFPYNSAPFSGSESLDDSELEEIDVLYIACHAKLDESLKILLASKMYPVTEPLIRIAAVNENRKIWENLARYLANSRKQLQTLCEKYLLNTEISQLQIRPGCLIGYRAAEAYQLLKAESIKIDHAEENKKWLVYYPALANVDLMDLLWNLGFRDVDEVDDEG